MRLRRLPVVLVLFSLGAVDGAIGQEPRVPICQMAPDDIYLPEVTTFDSFGRLYTTGLNVPSGNHEAYALQTAGQIQPRGRNGSIDLVDGKIGFVAIGMSNTTQIWSAFERDMYDHPNVDLRPGIVLLSLADGGIDIRKWNDIDTNQAWTDVVDDRLREAGLTAKQVQVVHLYVVPQDWTDDDQHTDFPSQQNDFVNELRTLVKDILPARFPRLEHVYVASRESGFWAGSDPEAGNQGEPVTYESGFGMKEAIDRFVTEIEDPLYTGPWVGWGPYAWTDGGTVRMCSDLSYELPAGFKTRCQDFEDCPDGNPHPSIAGEAKIARLYARFYSSDPIASQWFLRPPGPAADAGQIVLEPEFDGKVDSASGQVFWDEPEVHISHETNDDNVFLAFSIDELAQGPVLGDPQRILHATLSVRAAPCDQDGDCVVIFDAPGSCEDSDAVECEKSSNHDATKVYVEPFVQAEIENEDFPNSREPANRSIIRASRGTAMSWDVTANLQEALTRGEDTIGFRIDSFRHLVMSEFVDPPSGDTDPPRLIVHWRDPAE